MFRLALSLLALSALPSSALVAQDEYSIEIIDSMPEEDAASAEILKTIAPKGYRVKKGTRTAFELWLSKEWNLDEKIEPTAERIYPFKDGELIGLLHFGRRGADFRDQTINRGWFTLRYALMPTDGNHEGTSPTRDFLLMVISADDEIGKKWDATELGEASMEAAGSGHPAMMSLQRPEKDKKSENGSLRYDDYNDLWILHLVGAAKSGDKKQEFSLDVVVAGHAAE